MKRIKTLFRSDLIRNFLVYSLGALFLKGVSFFLIPLYTRLLSPEEYGYLDLLSTFASILEVLLSLGLAQVFYMEFFQVNREQRFRLLNQVLTLYLFISSALYLISFGLVWAVYDRVFENIRFYLVVLVMITTYLTFFQGLLILIFKLTSRAVRVTLLQVIFGVLSLALNVLFVYYLRSGYDGVIWAGAISMGLSTIYGFYLYKTLVKDFSYQIDFSRWRDLIKLGLPFIPNTLSFWMMNSANRWIILHYTGAEQVGYFSLAMKFGALFDPLLVQPFLSAYGPRMLKRFGDGNFKQPLLPLLSASLVFFIAAGFILQFLAGFMIDAAFNPALSLIPLIILGFAFNFMSQATAMILVFKRKVNILLVCILTGSAMSVILNFTLTPEYGSRGSAYGTVAGNIVWFMMILYFVIVERKKLRSTSIAVS